ncbi:hypothetical protein HMI55_003920 [Coelomomyces lativittatus]|nr:hypothetical protein HMI55_003920 [Coelomomyces lativittatus]
MNSSSSTALVKRTSPVSSNASSSSYPPPVIDSIHEFFHWDPITQTATAGAHASRTSYVPTHPHSTTTSSSLNGKDEGNDFTSYSSSNSPSSSFSSFLDSSNSNSTSTSSSVTPTTITKSAFLQVTFSNQYTSTTSPSSFTFSPFSTPSSSATSSPFYTPPQYPLPTATTTTTTSPQNFTSNITPSHSSSHSAFSDGRKFTPPTTSLNWNGKVEHKVDGSTTPYPYLPSQYKSSLNHPPSSFSPAPSFLVPKTPSTSSSLSSMSSFDPQKTSSSSSTPHTPASLSPSLLQSLQSSIQRMLSPLLPQPPKNARSTRVHTAHAYDASTSPPTFADSPYSSHLKPSSDDASTFATPSSYSFSPSSTSSPRPRPPSFYSLHSRSLPPSRRPSFLATSSSSPNPFSISSNRASSPSSSASTSPSSVFLSDDPATSYDSFLNSFSSSPSSSSSSSASPKHTLTTTTTTTNSSLYLPHLIMSYLQVIWNVAWICFIIFIIYQVYSSIQSDLFIKANEYANELRSQVAQCTREYHANRCDMKTRLPAMQQRCTQWESCMQKNPTQIGVLKIGVLTLAEVLDEFVEKLSIKTMTFFIFLGIMFYPFNLLFSWLRHQLHHPSSIAASSSDSVSHPSSASLRTLHHSSSSSSSATAAAASTSSSNPTLATLTPTRRDSTSTSPPTPSSSSTVTTTTTTTRTSLPRRFSTSSVHPLLSLSRRRGSALYSSPTTPSTFPSSSFPLASPSSPWSSQPGPGGGSGSVSPGGLGHVSSRRLSQRMRNE